MLVLPVQPTFLQHAAVRQIYFKYFTTHFTNEHVMRICTRIPDFSSVISGSPT